MKPEPNNNVDRYRIRNHPNLPDSQNGWNAGMFSVKRRTGNLVVMASDGSPEIPWEHVSVSLKNRCPTWQEMCIVKNMFWEKWETVIQYHPPESEYINNHEYCLHLWKPIGIELPLPPSIAVGLR